MLWDVGETEQPWWRLAHILFISLVIHIKSVSIFKSFVPFLIIHRTINADMEPNLFYFLELRKPHPDVSLEYTDISSTASV